MGEHKEEKGNLKKGRYLLVEGTEQNLRSLATEGMEKEHGFFSCWEAARHLGGDADATMKRWATAALRIMSLLAISKEQSRAEQKRTEERTGEEELSLTMSNFLGW